MSCQCARSFAWFATLCTVIVCCKPSPSSDRSQDSSVGSGALESVKGTPPARVNAPAPVKVGECARTTVKKLGTRLEGVDESGTAIWYENGLFQVSYDRVAAAEASKPGDPVQICLVSIPSECPPGDTRGRVYKTSNLRTGTSWELADSSHMCGGA